MHIREWHIHILVLAFILDLVFGDPRFLFHPVRGYGMIIGFWESFFRKRDAGREKSALVLYGFLLFVASALCLAAVYGLLYLPALWLFFYSRKTWLLLTLSLIFVYQLLACKSLRTESMKVFYALQKGETDKARKALSMIVGRDTENLTEEKIICAAVETVAENFSDGVAAPMLYYFIASVPGIILYKLVNTLDSMVGYKDDKYKEIGFFSAKLDDVLNYLPSRMAALLLLCASLFYRDMDTKEGLRIFKRDRYKHASPNSAQTEAVVAGLLGLRLAGPASYFGKRYPKEYIGDEKRKAVTEDIRRVNRLMYTASALLVLLLAAAGRLVLFVLSWKGAL